MLRSTSPRSCCGAGPPHGSAAPGLLGSLCGRSWAMFKVIIHSPFETSQTGLHSFLPGVENLLNLGDYCQFGFSLFVTEPFLEEEMFMLRYPVTR